MERFNRISMKQEPSSFSCGEIQRQIAFVNDNKMTNNISNERIKNTEVIVKEGF